MNLTSLLARAALITVLAGAAGLSGAQGTAPSAKKDLVQKVLTLQQAGIESVGVGIANQTASQVLQVAGQAMGRVPADKREALGAELQAEVRKFFDDVSPMLRASAVKNAPSTIGVALEEKFSEDELKVLISWLESPVSRKYQQMSPELQQGLGQKLVAERRPEIEAKLKALERGMGATLAAAVGPGPGAAGPRAAAPRAAGPVKK